MLEVRADVLLVVATGPEHFLNFYASNIDVDPVGPGEDMSRGALRWALAYLATQLAVSLPLLSEFGVPLRM